jgi:hypothetical protein
VDAGEVGGRRAGALEVVARGRGVVGDLANELQPLIDGGLAQLRLQAVDQQNDCALVNEEWTHVQPLLQHTLIV